MIGIISLQGHYNVVLEIEKFGKSLKKMKKIVQVRDCDFR